MKARNKKFAAISLSLILGTSAFATVLQAETITKSLKATFNDIKVTFNGENKQPAKEPFMIDGTVFVSLRDAGQMTGNNVDWDSANKTVKITPGAGSVSSTELANKNLEIANLKAQLKAAEDKLKKYEDEEVKVEDANLSESAIKETLNEIIDDYRDAEKVRWSFALKESKGALELTVSFDGRRYATEFGKLDEDDLADLLEDICYDIASNHKGIPIKGTLQDEYNRETIMSFTYSNKGSFDHKMESSMYELNKYAEDILYDRLYKTLPVINFENFPSTGIPLKDVKLEMNRRGDHIDFQLGIALSSEAEAAWNKLVQATNGDVSSSVALTAKLNNLENYMDDIAYDILKDFDVDSVTGLIYEIDGSNLNSPSTLLARYEESEGSLYIFEKK